MKQNDNRRACKDYSELVDAVRRAETFLVTVAENPREAMAHVHIDPERSAAQRSAKTADRSSPALHPARGLIWLPVARQQTDADQARGDDRPTLSVIAGCGGRIDDDRRQGPRPPLVLVAGRERPTVDNLRYMPWALVDGPDLGA